MLVVAARLVCRRAASDVRGERGTKYATDDQKEDEAEPSRAGTLVQGRGDGAQAVVIR